MAQKTLTDLPPELLLEIISYVQAEPLQARTLSGAEPAQDWTNPENPPLKSLRAVNKTLHGLFTPILFETVELKHHPDSWLNVNLIAISHLAPFVKEINVVSQRDLPIYSSIDEWERHVPYKLKWPKSWLPANWRVKYILPQKAEVLYCNPAAGGSVAKVDLSTRDQAYARYRYWADGEAVMHAHGDKDRAPPLLVDYFVNLRGFRTVGVYDSMTVKITPGTLRPTDAGEQYISASRRMIEASCTDTRDIQLRNTLLFLHAAYDRGVSLHNMTVSDCRALGHLQLPSIQRLEIKLRYLIDSPGYEDYENVAQQVADCLCGLRELVIIQERGVQDKHFGLDIFEILRGAVFAKLDTLELRYVRTSTKALAVSIQAHSQSLKCLRIISPRIPREEWRLFREWCAQGREISKVYMTEERLEVGYRLEPDGEHLRLSEDH